MSKIKQFLKKLIYGPRADSDRYIRYLRSLGVRIGKDCIIYVPSKTLIDTQRPWMIEIGDHVLITEGVKILQHGYEWAVLKRIHGPVIGSAGKVSIGNNVFIGMNAVILKGVTIGDNTIIGAGSIVSGDIPGNCVAAGNPCRPIMSLEAYYEKRQQAQLGEAIQLVQEYRKVYHREPGESELAEFVWLFSDAYRGKPLPEPIAYKMHHAENFDLTLQLMQDHQSPYPSLEAFLASIPKES